MATAFCCSGASAGSSRSAQFDAGDALEQRLLAVGPGLDDDVAELLRIQQAALGVDLELESATRLARVAGRPAPAAIWTFCSRMALTMSLAVRSRAAALIGIDPDRIA
jgi:hypothetical protein